MIIAFTVLIFIVLGFILFRVFQKSEHDAARPLEKPSREDLTEANLSPHLPVADIEEDPKR